MKKLVIALILSSASMASANTISVEFTPCSNNPAGLCALVYGDQTANLSYNGQEMLAQADNFRLSTQEAQDLENRMAQSIISNGRSLTTNVEGRVVTVHSGFGSRSYQQLMVTSFSNSGSR